MRLMISLNRFIIPCSLATTTVLINPFLYDAIAILFIGFFSVVLLSNNFGKFNWQIEGIRETVVLISLIVMCLIVPQVETDLSKFSVSAIVEAKS